MTVSAPIDRGWAWVVVASAFMTCTFLIGGFKCFGMIFAEMMQRYQGSASGTSMMLALASGLSMLIGPLVAALCDIFTCRAVAMAGGIICCLGFVIPAYCNTLEAITLILGILTGIGSGMSLLPGTVTVGYYFESHRSMANGLLFSGGGFGGIIMPFIVNYIIDSYGINCALVALAGLALNTVVFSSFFRPMSYWTSSTSISTDPAREEDQLEETEYVRDLIERLNSAPGYDKAENLTSNNNYHHRSFPVLPGSDPKKWRIQNGIFRLNSIKNADIGSNSTLYLSALDIATVVPLSETPDPSSNRLRILLNRICHRTGPNGDSIPLLDFSLLKDTTYLLILISGTFFISIIHISMIIPPHCLELGMTKAQVATLLSIQGASDMAGRLLMGFTGDRSCVKSRRHSIALFCFVVLMISTFVSVTLTTFWGQAMYLTISSLGRGGIVALMPVVVVDLVGSEKFARALGLSAFFQAFSVTATPVIIGALRDFTLSYASGLIFLGSGFTVCVCCFILIILIERRRSTAQPVCK